jgi:hypothetical protein
MNLLGSAWTSHGTRSWKQSARVFIVDLKAAVWRQMAINFRHDSLLSSSGGDFLMRWRSRLRGCKSWRESKGHPLTKSIFLFEKAGPQPFGSGKMKALSSSKEKGRMSEASWKKSSEVDSTNDVGLRLSKVGRGTKQRVKERVHNRGFGRAGER